jgi:hypothetical protein
MIDASRFMPSYVFGRDLIDEEERVKYATENDKKCLEKHGCWYYEEEARISLHEPTAWLFGEHFTYSKEERLLHYQPTQLIGIILGALMEPKTKERVHEIIVGLRERISRTNIIGPVFDFVLFEASISDKQRTVEIRPKEIFMSTIIIPNNDPQFTSRYKKWEDGEAIVLDGKGGAKKQFLK